MSNNYDHLNGDRDHRWRQVREHDRHFDLSFIHNAVIALHKVTWAFGNKVLVWPRYLERRRYRYLGLKVVARRPLGVKEGLTLHEAADFSGLDQPIL